MPPCTAPPPGLPPLEKKKDKAKLYSAADKKPNIHPRHLHQLLDNEAKTPSDPNPDKPFLREREARRPALRSKSRA